MKIRSVKIEDFKGTKSFHFDLLNLEDNPRNLTCIVGDNGSLSQIGPNCRFIVSTHSQYLTNAIPDEQEVHIEGEVRWV